MYRSFNQVNASNSFYATKEPFDSSDYIQRKKAKTVFCGLNPCTQKISTPTQGELTMLGDYKTYLKDESTDKTFNVADLNVNLITTMDLSNVTMIKNIPIPNQNVASYFFKYYVDPSGVLFGSSSCGLFNYQKFLKFNPPYDTIDP